MPTLSIRRSERRRSFRSAVVPLLLVVAFAAAGPARAGAWTKDKGEGLWITAGTFTYGDKTFDQNGRLQPIPIYRKFELTGYGEYGVTDWLTAIVTTQARDESSDMTIYNSSVAGALGARIRLHKTDTWILSGELTALSGDFNAPGLLPTGDGPGLDARLLIGTGFRIHGMTGWAEAQAGYRWRSASSPDEVRVDLTVGLKPTPNWMVMAQLFNTFSVQPVWYLPGESYRYHKVMLSAVRKFGPRLSLQAGPFAAVDGVDALDEVGGMVAVWLNF